MSSGRKFLDLHPEVLLFFFHLLTSISFHFRISIFNFPFFLFGDACWSDGSYLPTFFLVMTFLLTSDSLNNVLRHSRN